MVLHERLVSFLLRVGLAVAFLYAATASFLDPSSWVGFIPSLVREFIPGQVFLVAFSLFEIALALWLLTGRHVLSAAWASIVTLLLIIVGNLPLLDVVFRDLAILAAAGALLAFHWKNKEL